jgi:hypothetical protein
MRTETAVFLLDDWTIGRVHGEFGERPAIETPTAAVTERILREAKLDEQVAAAIANDRDAGRRTTRT